MLFEIGIDSKTLDKQMKKSKCKAIIKEKSDERINREIQQKNYNHEEIEIPEGKGHIVMKVNICNSVSWRK